LDENSPFFREAYTFFRLPSLIQELTALVNEQLPGDQAKALDYIEAVGRKGEAYIEYANTLDGLCFDDKYKGDEETAVKDIRAMGNAYIEMVEALINASEANRDPGKMVEDMLYSKDSVSVTNRLNPVVVEWYENGSTLSRKASKNTLSLLSLLSFGIVSRNDP